MTEEKGTYQLTSHPGDRGEGFERLAGSRVLAVRLVRAKSEWVLPRYEMWLMLDDGTWVAVRATGFVAPLTHEDKLDLRQLEERGWMSYDTIHLSVADPDSRQRVRVLDHDRF